MTITELWDATQRGGLPFILFLIILAGFKEVWVWGYQYRQAIKERDEWKRLALRGTNLADAATDAGERATGG